MTQAKAQVTTESHLTSSHKIEELFIWKISEELKLSSKEEKEFAKTFKMLNSKKVELNSRIQEIIKSLGPVQNSKEKAAKLNDYKKALQAYNKISIDEYDLFKAQFGTERLSQYLELKFNLTTKLKELLIVDLNDKSEKGPLGESNSKLDNSSPPSSKKPLPPPRIIEEK